MPRVMTKVISVLEFDDVTIVTSRVMIIVKSMITHYIYTIPNAHIADLSGSSPHDQNMPKVLHCVFIWTHIIWT